MRWLLAGCCGLALINISVALHQNLPISQKPRFYGVKAGRDVGIFCLCSNKHKSTIVEWHRVTEYNQVIDGNSSKLATGKKYEFINVSNNQNIFLLIHDVSVDDNGVYFCKTKDHWGPGTAVQVIRNTGGQGSYRSKMKDVLIILQALLLAVCIAAVLLRKHQQLEKKDSIYEEPEIDHIYEGLAIETCSGGLYEELSVYAQAEGAEAPWQ
ncbi:hypothetical protein PBY51_001972 [Eleginops maclovinus]|uniref:Ig-like domain-containing protein n=1 Tax=Eleginops maclovinus TaxID=56733 RepID=A0AAN8A127_ELEMC|nr:hypothetical protein PBY51_001972 [Eleginops maclovinus]